MTVSVVVPVLNEEQNVRELAGRVAKVLAPETADFELIFVDDGSTDRTAAILRDLHVLDPRIKYAA